MLLSCDVCLCLCCPSSLPCSQAVSVTSSAPVVSGGAGATERNPPICEGELCGVSSPSVRPGWNSPYLFAVFPLGCPLSSVHMKHGVHTTQV